MEEMPQIKPRRRWRKVVAKIVAGVMIFLLLVWGTAKVFHNRWNLYGGFKPNIELQSKNQLYKQLESHRAAQEKSSPRSTASNQSASSTPAKADWPQYRGANRDGISAETELFLSRIWPPPELYRQPIGGGWAGFVAGAGRAYTIEQRRKGEAVTCYDLNGGRELWAFEYPAHFDEQMGGEGPRATPTLDGDTLFVLGAEGDLHCLDSATGKLLWKANILKETGARNLAWAMSGAPLVVDKKVFVTASGLEKKNSLLAYEKNSGKLLLKTLPEQQAYSSLMLVTLCGKRQILNLAAANLHGIEIETGEVLWSFPWTTTNGINCAQPILAGEDRIFISAEYGKGCALVQISLSDGKWSARQLWANLNMKNKFNSSVLHDGSIYGLDAGILACLDLKDGKRRWKEGRYGYGQMIYADGHLIVLGEHGELALVKATPDGFQELANNQALHDKTWNNPALSNGRLLIRNDREMVCYDLRGKSSGAGHP